MNKQYIIVCILFLSLFLFFKVFSSPSTCNNPISMPPPGCGQTLTNLCTATGYDYFNYTLFTDTDIHIVTADVFLGGYNMTAFFVPTVCDPSDPNNRTNSGGVGLSPDIYLNGLEGDASGNTYYILIGSLGGNDCSNSDYFYSLTLDCGNWCGNGILEADKGEDCDYGNWDTGTARCKPYGECRSNCRCYDLRQDAVGCDFYDYCEDGMNHTDNTLSCCIDAVGQTTPCCLDSFNNPALNCSQVNYRRNPTVNASSEYCYVQGYDITDVCIDDDALSHALRINCGSV